MRYWRDREVSDRLSGARAYRKEVREKQSDTQLVGGVGFWFEPATEHDD